MSGTTTLEPRRWWGRAWHDTLAAAGPSGTRAAQRGQALSRRGAVEDLSVAPGRIQARVVGDRGEIQEISISCPTFGTETWEIVIDRLADELRFTAALLDGSLPEGIQAIFDDLGTALVPSFEELTIRCSCRDRGLCRHAAAVHASSGVAIDRDPFLLVRLRGSSRDDLIRQLRGRRGETGASELGRNLDTSTGFSSARGDLDAIRLQPTPVEDPAALLRHLGPPPGVDDDRPLELLIERAAAAAWRLAAGDGADAADEELLLAELRAQRTATPDSLATALGRDPTDVRVELDRLFDAGVVMRTGSGDRARYRAASGRG